MFSNQSTNDQVQTGKRILGMQQRKGQFNLKWDQGKNILNAYQQKKVKQVTQKPNYVQQKVKREGNDRRGVSPYQIPSNQFINPNQQIQVMGYLKKYQKIEEMPADELEKVMAYYDSLKQPKKGYQKQQEFETPSNQYIERRQPIKPKQTAGNIIYGSSQQSGTKPGSRYSQKTNTNSNAFVIGDGYNYFKQDKERKLEQQRLKSQNPNQYVPRNEFKQVSNLRLG